MDLNSCQQVDLAGVYVMLKYKSRIYRNRSLTYSDVIISRFGENEFTAKELVILTENSRSAKLLSELKMRGIVERVDRGKYRVLPLSERPDTRIIEWRRARNIIINAPWKKAWTGSTTVEVWTNGRYKISPNPYLRVFHLSVLKPELDKWRKYLRRFGISYSGKKRVGCFVDLKRSLKVNSTIVAGEPAITKGEVLKLIRNHPGIYAGTCELIESGISI